MGILALDRPREPRECPVCDEEFTETGMTYRLSISPVTAREGQRTPIEIIRSTLLRPFVDAAASFDRSSSNRSR